MGTTKQWLDPKGANVFTTTPPEFVQANGSNFPMDGYAFDPTAVEQMFFEVPAINYGSGNLTVYVDFYVNNATGGTVWQAGIAVTTPSDTQSLLTDAFAGTNNSSAVVSVAANAHMRATITITNLDSLANDDRFALRIARLATDAGDTNTIDATCFGVWIMWSDI